MFPRSEIAPSGASDVFVGRHCKTSESKAFATTIVQRIGHAETRYLLLRDREAPQKIEEPGARTGQETIEEAIIETYLTDASTRRIEGFAESKG